MVLQCYHQQREKVNHIREESTATQYNSVYYSFKINKLVLIENKAVLSLQKSSAVSYKVSKDLKTRNPTPRHLTRRNENICYSNTYTRIFIIPLIRMAKSADNKIVHREVNKIYCMYMTGL